MDLNFLNFFGLQQIIFIYQIFEATIFSWNLVDPLKGILLRGAFWNSKVGKRTHLSIDKSVS